ncbi:MAG: hypothetical protein ACI8TX_003047, partial [Hyphomicrobiaceae bacterium]
MPLRRKVFPVSRIWTNLVCSRRDTPRRREERLDEHMDIYRGDVEYQRLLERSQAWGTFDTWINS